MSDIRGRKNFSPSATLFGAETIPSILMAITIRIEGGQNGPHRLFRKRGQPYIFVGGGSEAARALSISQGSCWIRLADTPANLVAGSSSVLEAGKELGVRVGVICRPTRDRGDSTRPWHWLLVLTRSYAKGNRSVNLQARRLRSPSGSLQKMAEEEWPAPWLCAGLVRSCGKAAHRHRGQPGGGRFGFYGIRADRGDPIHHFRLAETRRDDHFREGCPSLDSPKRARTQRGRRDYQL